MKILKNILAVAFISALAFNCSSDDDSTGTPPDNPVALDFSGTYTQQDQMGRPAINTVFGTDDAAKDAFNVTIPSEQNAAFQAAFQTNLMALSPTYATDDDRNALGFNAAEFTGLLSTDVLNVSLDGTTTFFDGNPDNLLSGRNLTDDVITVELILIFGGETGLTMPEAPGLSDDNVDANDKPFSESFPYLASAWPI